MNDIMTVLPQEPLCAETKHFSKTQQILSFACMVLGFLFIRLCCYHTSGLLTTLLFWAVTGVNLWFLRRNGRALAKEDRVLAGIVFLFGAVYTITANPFLKLLNTVFLIGMEALLCYSICHRGEEVFRYLPISVKNAVLRMPFSGFGDCPKAAISVLKGTSSAKNILYVCGGLLLALPLTFVVGGLLASADDNMERILEAILNLPTDGLYPLLPHLFFGILCGCWLFGLLYAGLSGTFHPAPEECEARIRALRFLPNPMAYAAVTPVCILYVLYFFSQMGYFLGGFTGELAEGFTYAEYARQGFFELCAVCFINACVIGALAFHTKQSGAAKPLMLKVYTLFLGFASLILAGTAIAKMLLYIGEYGMTPLRVYTTWFMLLLMVCFVLVIVRQFRPLLPVCRIGFAAFVLFFGLLCFSRPDAWIAKYNAEMYIAGELEEFDSDMIATLSDDAAAALLDYTPHQLGTTEIRTSILRAQNGYERDPYRAMNLSAWMILLEGGRE